MVRETNINGNIKDGDVNIKIQLKCIINQLNKLIDFHLNKDRNKSWSKFISKLPTGSKKFWKLTKAFKNNKTAFTDLHVNEDVLKSGD